MGRNSYPKHFHILLPLSRASAKVRGLQGLSLGPLIENYWNELRFSCVLSIQRLMRALLLLSVLLLSPLTAACNQQLIPNTDVVDVPENRKVIEFCEVYRHAVERREVGKLFSLAHPKYYENGGNIDASDDIDYAGLKEFLRERFSAAKGIRYEIRYRRIQRGSKNVILVDYTYSASYQLPSENGEDDWHRKVEDNRLELVPHKDSFLILSGM